MVLEALGKKRYITIVHQWFHIGLSALDEGVSPVDTLSLELGSSVDCLFH